MATAKETRKKPQEEAMKDGERPTVYIVILTKEREDYAERTLRTALEHLNYDGYLSVHIADDGSSQAHRDMLVDIAKGHPKVRGVTVTNAEGGGYGRSYNLALQVVHQHAEVVLPLEDDWVLVRELNLGPLVGALTTPMPDTGVMPFGCIRMGYIGWTQQLRGELIEAHGQHFLLFDPDSPEPHVWSGHPRLETREWERRVGPWPEDEPSPGTTEFIVAHRREAREGVVWPLDLVRPYGDLFAHIGTVQARTDQREAVPA